VGFNLPVHGVSGDFYDWLALPDGRIAFCVADVSGKGIDAAILMAKTASLFRCIARTRPEPGALLGQLNDEILETVTRGMFVTMAAGVLSAGRDVVRLANAGHPPALLRGADGSWRELPSGAPPLGIAPLADTGGNPPEVEVALGGGSLYLFSDGITESPGPEGGMLGMAGLRREIDRLAGGGPRALVDGLLARLASARPRDDLTLLVVQGGSGPVSRRIEPLLTHRLVARPERLGAMRQAVADACRRAGCGEPCTRDVVLAVDEACQNVIRHGYHGDRDGEIVLELLRDGPDLVVYLRDFAPKVDPGKVHPRELEDLRPGGLGTHFIREVMDAQEFLAAETGAGNVLRMRKRIQ
jgi:sigma-B regulation protein RsbU (phosphoserine phosphatase)